MYQIENRRIILKVIAEYLLLPHMKLFQKTKRGLELVVPFKTLNVRNADAMKISGL